MTTHQILAPQEIANWCIEGRNSLGGERGWSLTWIILGRHAERGVAFQCAWFTTLADVLAAWERGQSTLDTQFLFRLYNRQTQQIVFLGHPDHPYG